MAVPGAAAVLEQQIERLNRRDVAATLELYADDCVLEELCEDGQVLHGQAELRGYLEELLVGLAPLRIEIVALVAEVDRAAVQLILTGTHSGEFLGLPPSGRPVRYRAAAFHDLRDGKTVRERAYFDPAELTAALSG